MPRHPRVADAFRWYVRVRRRAPKGAHERFDQAIKAFSAPRFRALYRAWLERGDPTLDATLSPTLADAIERGAGRPELSVMPHQYLHPLALAGAA